MRPMISNTPYYRLTIPELSGGVNLRDGISLIQDNQLTDCKNVWYKDGMLRTRPGVRSYNSNPDIEEIENDPYTSVSDKVYADPKNYRVIGGVTYFLVCTQSFGALEFRYYRGDGKVEDDTGLPYLWVGGIYADELPPGDYTCNIFQHGSDIYCFCSGYYEWEAVPYYIYKISELGTDAAKAAWSVSRVGVDEDAMPYVPTIAINGHGRWKAGFPSLEETLEGATMLEGFNLLGNRCKLFYSTVDKDRLKVNSVQQTELAAHDMIYEVPFAGAASELIPSTLKITITYPWGSATHTATVPDGGSIFFEERYNDDDLKMNVYCNGDFVQVVFVHKNEPNFPHYVTENDYAPNNMEIITPCTNSRENYEKVLNMSFNEWYGGGSEGLYGGIHLFMGGNKGDEKSLVCWSDFNKPLYFSENNYTYVGDKSQAVTAFGKQGESLIVFKEREMYATQYSTLNDAISADDVINQAVVDVAANEVAFPMVQVHGFIGCDCPKTVQLCRNRLVWAYSDGKIYTLVSANQYNERSIFEVSDMIERRLKTHSVNEIQSALSADWEGHYVLSVGDKLYLMDYNSYGYSNIYSYSKSEDAQERIPWWLWDIPEYVPHNNLTTQEYEKRSLDVRAMVSIADRLFVSVIMAAPTQTQGDRYLEEILYFEKIAKDFIPLFTATEHQGYVYYGRVDTMSYEIPSMLQTKFFDFGSPTVKKNIPKVEVAFGTNGGVPIKTTVITENTADEGEFVIDEPEEQEYAAGYFQNRLIRPGNKRACRIGLRFESEGDMSIDAISLQYKILGGLK